MNIEEAKKIVDKLSVDSDELWKIPMIPAHKVKALLDTLDQPKPEVPQFVADYIDDMHKNARTLRYAFKCMESNIKMHKWCVFERQETFINAFLHGYTIEKEKLYTVDLPNGQPLVRGINTLYFSQNLATENVKLTESEIRKDFEWAWQFAEEVTG